MTTIEQFGIAAVLPTGWEGRIFTRDAPVAAAAPPPGGAPSTQRSSEPPPPAPSPGRTNPMLHLANFPLPAVVEDYGGHAVELMTNLDLLVVVVEFGPASAGTALFAAEGFPKLRKEDFSPSALQRQIDGQGATQQFFNVSGRPFCLYVVLGSHARRVRTVPVVNEVLAGVNVT